MNDVSYRLNQELEQIRYSQKKELGINLTEEDIHIIFRILQDQDQEMKPMLAMMEIMASKLIKDDYLLVEKYMGELLKYYQLLPNDDFINCRHKLFFTDSKQLVKKSFFGPTLVEKVKDELAIHNIFKKL
jgi:hypothetical protein